MTLVDPQAARAAIGGLLLAFNPNQRRGDDGKWTKIGGGSGPSVRAERAARRGLRPTASDSVELPPRPGVKPAPSGSIMGPNWIGLEDPGDRAAHFWQGRFSDQQAIRQVFRNISAGRDPVDGLDLETNRNWDLDYLRAERPRPRGVSWEEWEEKHPNGEGAPRVYDRADLRDELVNAGRWLHEQLANAPVTTQPLYRGMRMKKADVPQVGEEFDVDVASWAEERWQIERYAWMPEDPELGRVGEMEVVLRLNGPKRSVDLGPGLLDEHLTQGRYRVAKVSGRGRKRFITLEEVAE